LRWFRQEFFARGLNAEKGLSQNTLGRFSRRALGANDGMMIII
jgi:hypothetical protein